jgi:hypothetical protein
MIYSASPGVFSNPNTLNNTWGIYCLSNSPGVVGDSQPAFTINRGTRDVTCHRDLEVVLDIECQGVTAGTYGFTTTGNVTAEMGYLEGLRLDNASITSGSSYSGYIQFGDGADGELYIARRGITNDMVFDRGGYEKMKIHDYVTVAQRLQISPAPGGSYNYNLDVLDNNFSVKADETEVFSVSSSGHLYGHGHTYLGPGVVQGTGSQTSNTEIQTRILHISDVNYIQGGRHQSDTDAEMRLTRYYGYTLKECWINAVTTKTLDLEPNSNGTYSLGRSGNVWADVWAADTSINSSDRRLKRDIEDIPVGLDFINSLRPVQWVWKDKTITVDDSNDEHPNRTKEVTKTYSRKHWGHISQEVKATMDSYGVDSGLFIDPSVNGEEGTQGLRSCELIPVLVKAIQELSQRIINLEYNEVR